MRKGAGHVDGTSVWNGNVALCGHNRGSWPYFGTLKNVQAGEVIAYRTSLGTRAYRVVSAGRILATNTVHLHALIQTQSFLRQVVLRVNRSHFGSDLPFFPPFARLIFRCLRPALLAPIPFWVKSS